MHQKCLFSLIVAVCCVCSSRSQQEEDHQHHELQQRSPPPLADDGDPSEYSGPVLGGGIGTVSDDDTPRRRYPERKYDRVDPGSAFRDGSVDGGTSYYNPGYPPESDYPVRNVSNGGGVGDTYRVRTTPPSRLKVTPGPRPAKAPANREEREETGGPSTRDPFQDPNRYRIAQQNDQRDGVKFVNGRPYR